MARIPDIAADGALDALLEAQDAKPTLRLLTCGSVDDGKSTLIGRLLYDSRMLFDDQMAALETESRAHGTTGGLDFALLVDGLQAEREQGITIDVAYRFFATERRRFIVADTPGHEQYTRNMATGASTAELAVILVDARKGLLPQTRRHSHICALFGIRHVVLAVNKMDLVGWDRARFEAIAGEYAALAARLGLAVTAIPVCATAGDNVFAASRAAPWYDGPTLMAHLEAVDVSGAAEGPFRMAVQWVCRPDAEFRGFAGRIAGGTARPGDAVAVMPSGRTTRIARIVTADGELERASAGRSVVLTFADEVDASRGDLIAGGAPPAVADQLAAHLVWFDDAPLLPGRRYLVKAGARTLGGAVTALKHRVEINTLEHQAATTLQANEIGAVNLALDGPLAFDPYAENRDTGAFILIDPLTNRTAGAGTIDHALRRATNIHWHETEVDRAGRAALKGQRPCVLWFTGLSGAGKSTVANLVERRLHAEGRHTYLLDGDNLRHGLNRDLGFTPEARVENVRRVGEVARLFVDAGLIVLVSLISPFRAEREAARALLGEGEFLEIHVTAPLAVCEARDPKGLYAKARQGEIPNFTGIDSPYEPPPAPELTIDTAALTPEEACERIVGLLRREGRI
ncbi:MAG TPA: sulfate adenylyltransferase subunit CysN [Alphaproteobacteria bacterium]|nr:sulfate adenylyltransferase subunit CysN [Alphaproteobacteria bacterium]